MTSFIENLSMGTTYHEAVDMGTCTEIHIYSQALSTSQTSTSAYAY